MKNKKIITPTKEKEVLLNQYKNKIDENKEKIISISRKVESESLHVGPIPSPQCLSGYEQLCLGATDRIITMAEKEQEMQHRITLKTLNADLLGRWFGFIIIILAICLTTYALYLDKSWVAKVLLAIIGSISILCGIISVKQNNNKSKINNKKYENQKTDKL